MQDLDKHGVLVTRLSAIEEAASMEVLCTDKTRTLTLIVLLLFANDFVTMSIAADHATPTPTPDCWQVGQLVGSALALSAVLLVESFLVLRLMLGVFHQSLAQTQTLVFLILVFSSQTTGYVVRERGHFWSSPHCAICSSSRDLQRWASR